MSSQRIRSKTNNDNIKVLVRCRPLLQFQNQPAWQITQSNRIQCMHTKSVRQKLDKSSRRSQGQIESKFKQMNFQFQKVFQDTITSQRIYKQQAIQMVRQALAKNKNLTLMCYGQTCSGKTFTILGQEKLPGLMPCCLRDLMIYKEQQQNCQIKISYFQIYNQNVYDLLTVKGRKSAQSEKLKLYEDKAKGWEVQGLKVEKVENFQDCMGIVQKGQRNRAYASKQNHQRSSRSHTIMRIHILKQSVKFTKIHQTFNIVDLAGSQKLSLTSSTSKATTKQSTYINKSLFQLSNVISKLSLNDSSSHIPFRDSKLTKILETSLKGQSLSLIVFCISPAVEAFNQSISTLRLAKKAKLIQMYSNEEAQMTGNWSPLEIQLLWTKQKLKQKTKQCDNLQRRLQYLTSQVDRLQEYFQQIQIKNESRCHMSLMVLFDYDNFVIQNGSQYQTNRDGRQNQPPLVGFTSTESKELQRHMQEYKISFRQQLQKMYTQYAENIVRIHLDYQKTKDKAKINKSKLNNLQMVLKIQQIMWLKMSFDYSLVSEQKAKFIKQTLKQLQFQNKNKDKNKDKNKNQSNMLSAKFIPILKSYHAQLTKFNPTKQSTYNFNDSQVSILNNTTKSKEMQSELFHSNIQHVHSRIDWKNKAFDGRIRLFSWGCSKDGRVFKGDNVLPGIQMLQKQIYGKIKQIRTSYNHSLFLTQSGKVYGWGKNNFNQVSSKSTPAHSLPKQIGTKWKVKSLATGWGHSLALTQEGRVYTWGYGQNGQLGHGNLQNVLKPQILQLSSLQEQINCKQVFAGHSHSAILSQSHQLYTFGFNKDYRCMQKLQAEGQCFITTPRKLKLNKIKHVSLGVSHSCVLTEDNFAFCGGVGTNGEFGTELSLQTKGCEFVEVQCKKVQGLEDEQKRYQRVCPIMQFGGGDFEDALKMNQFIVDTKCGQNSTYLLTSMGNLYLCGKGLNKKSNYNIYTPKIILTNVSSFSIGSRHGFAFTQNSNNIYAWGFNMYNQLGNNKQKDILIPEVIPGLSSLNFTAIQCGFIHTIALGK